LCAHSRGKRVRVRNVIQSVAGAVDARCPCKKNDVFFFLNKNPVLTNITSKRIPL